MRMNLLRDSLQGPFSKMGPNQAVEQRSRGLRAVSDFASAREHSSANDLISRYASMHTLPVSSFSHLKCRLHLWFLATVLVEPQRVRRYAYTHWYFPFSTSPKKLWALREREGIWALRNIGHENTLRTPAN
jgi:hypothetical protein